jgi:predicted component of type VI protein secretion system
MSTVSRLITSDAGAAERRAEALAMIQQTDAQYTAAKQEIVQLKADLNREIDRCAMLLEERDKYRAMWLTDRTSLAELAAKQSSISLLCVPATEIMMTLREVHQAPTPSSEALDKLEASYVDGNKPAAVA